MNRFKGQRGMSLVEATIILLVLMLLTGVIAPSIMDFVNDARRVKVKEDCEAIGVTVVRLVRDIGPCLMFDGRQVPVGPGCTKANRVDTLISDGVAIDPVDLVGNGNIGYVPPTNTANQAVYSWATSANRDTMEHQFVTNSPNYPTPATMQVLGFPAGGVYSYPKPWFGYGWRGAYLQSPVSWDPWGKPYVVNTIFLATARDSDPSAACGEGMRCGGWSRTVFCLSAGANTFYETGYWGNLPANGVGIGGVLRGGDDYFYPISGNTH